MNKGLALEEEDVEEEEERREGRGLMQPHSWVDLHCGHKLRAVCLGLIVNQGHPGQIYVAL